VHTTDEGVHTPPVVGVERRAQPPQEGDSPQNIVNGFLQAMTAFPVNIQVARSFLATGEADAWDPSQRTITYQGPYSPTGTGDVTVRLNDAHWLDARGTWRGELGTGARRLRFSLALENAEWRIASAPNAFIIPDDWFQDHYTQASAFYLDPTANILVPEPIFVPADQLAPALVRALLDGPGPSMDDVSRTFVPTGLTPGLSVPVSADGVATILLDGEVGRLTPETVKLLVYQFAWTLKQDPDISSFRITIGDEPLTMAGGTSQFSVELGSEYAPTDVQASGLLFAVRDGVLESGDPTELATVDGPFGSYGAIESVGVSLKAEQAAAVTGGGTTVMLAGVNDDNPPLTQIVSSATRLLQPAWDFDQHLWLVDRTAEGAQVSQIDTSRSLVPVSVPIRGITDRQVKDFIISRDGTRLVAVVRGRIADQLRVSRIRHDTLGRVIGATPSRALPWSTGDAQRIRDIGWRSPTTVAVLHLLTRQVPQIVSVSVDGAGPQDRIGQQDVATALVASPDSAEPLYTRTEDGLLDLEGGPIPLSQEVTSIQYVG
jgi:hypothetical protein